MDLDKKTKNLNLRKLILEKLAEHLGVEYNDISEEDSLIDDLHMEASDLSDFVSSLEKSSVDLNGVDLKEIETVSDLIDNIALNQPL